MRRNSSLSEGVILLSCLASWLASSRAFYFRTSLELSCIPHQNVTRLSPRTCVFPGAIFGKGPALGDQLLFLWLIAITRRGRAAAPNMSQNLRLIVKEYVVKMLNEASDGMKALILDDFTVRSRSYTPTI